MNKMSAEEYAGVRDRAELLVDRSGVERALDRMAAELTEAVGGADPVLLCMVNGGIVTTGLLLPRLGFPLRLDYVHATRYRDATRGGELRWHHRPAEAVRGEAVVVIDDIFDEGITLARVVEACRADGAASVLSVVMTSKDRRHATDYRPDIVGLTLPDRYVIGYGLDYKHYFRNAPGIFAVADRDI
jgi:hypoxanthine phosphoribosyltransferase